MNQEAPTYRYVTIRLPRRIRRLPTMILYLIGAMLNLYEIPARHSEHDEDVELYAREHGL